MHGVNAGYSPVSAAQCTGRGGREGGMCARVLLVRAGWVYVGMTSAVLLSHFASTLPTCLRRPFAIQALPRQRMKIWPPYCSTRLSLPSARNKLLSPNVCGRVGTIFPSVGGQSITELLLMPLLPLSLLAIAPATGSSQDQSPCMCVVVCLFVCGKEVARTQPASSVMHSCMGG